MSTSPTSDEASQEQQNSPENFDFQSAQPIQESAVSYRPLKRGADFEEADFLPISSNLEPHESDSDEYHRPRIRSKRKGKERATENENAPQLETTFDRSNRFYGPPSTWLSWTQSERETIKALDQERNENLSAHLYVAHKITRYARSIQQTKSRRGGARHASSTDDDEARRVGEKPFVPPKVWTAWPMPPEQVPRLFHTTGILDANDPLTIQGPQDTRPSAELEGCLIATMTRNARQIWESREWDDDRSQANGSAPPRNANTGGIPPESSQQASKPNHSQTEGESNSPPIFISSQPQPQHQSPSPHSHPQYPARPAPHPNPLTDTYRAHTLLLPTTRHLLSQLDHLLLALHRMQAPQYTSAHQTQSRSINNNSTTTATQTQTDTEPGPAAAPAAAITNRSRPPHRRRQISKKAAAAAAAASTRSQSQRQTVSPDPSAAAAAAAAAATTDDTNPTQQQAQLLSQAEPQPRRRRRSRLHSAQSPRTWLDILTLAHVLTTTTTTTTTNHDAPTHITQAPTLTNNDDDNKNNTFHPAAIARASQRCVRLFGGGEEGGDGDGDGDFGVLGQVLGVGGEGEGEEEEEDDDEQGG